MVKDVVMTDAPDPLSSGIVPTQYDRITNDKADIATTSDLDKMMVELVGRQPLQRVYLWTGANESSEGRKKTSSSQTTNKPYKPEEDGPAAAGLPEALPTTEELVHHETAVEYLEVGLVIGEDPHRVKNLHKPRTKEARTTSSLTRDTTALRAFILVTPFVAKQAKYYVGCKPTAGRCFPRVIDGDCIFYYAEFWHGLPDKLNKKERRDFVNTRTKYHAAVNKVALDRSTAAVTFTKAEKWATAKPLAVTQIENVASMLVLQLSMFHETENPDYLKSINNLVENAAPDTEMSPYNSDSGVVAFYDFDEELSEDDAKAVKRELRATIPDMADLDIAQIQLVHRVIRDNGWSERLPYSGLAFFLEYCHDGISEGATAEREVERALRVVTSYNKYGRARPTGEEEPISKDDDRLLLECVRDVVQSICDYIRESNMALVEQYGGVLRHGSVKDLMNNNGNAVDVVHQRSYWEQNCALHAIQHTSTNSKVSDKLKELHSVLATVLKARSVTA